MTNHTTSSDERRVGDYIGSVNQQGRVTIPDEVRRALNIHPQDKIVFRITDDVVEISGKLPTLEELAGSMAALDPAKNLNEVIREVKEERADRLLQTLQQP